MHTSGYQHRNIYDFTGAGFLIPLNNPAPIPEPKPIPLNVCLQVIAWIGALVGAFMLSITCWGCLSSNMSPDQEQSCAVLCTPTAKIGGSVLLALGGTGIIISCFAKCCRNES